YMASASLRRFEDDGRPEEDLPLLQWAVADSLQQVENALHAVLQNFPIAALGGPLRVLLFPWGRRQRPVDDRITHRIARLAREASESRGRLIAGAYRSRADDASGWRAQPVEAALAAAPAEMAVRDALKTVPTPVNVDRVV